MPHKNKRLELFEEVWLLRSLTGRILRCAIYRTTGPGVEVRVDYGEDLLYSRRVRDEDAARHEAEDIRRMVLARNNFYGTCLSATCYLVAHFAEGHREARLD